MAEISKEQFLSEYSDALDDGDAALFIGAGVSVASGMVDWRGLLRDIARGLGLDVDEESDLIALAQYEYNNSGTRHRLNTAILDEFKKLATLSANHKWLAQLPVETVWTTNYDPLLEQPKIVTAAIGASHFQKPRFIQIRLRSIIFIT